MCVIMVVPSKCSVDNDTLASAWAFNQDGGGFSYVKDGVVVTSKGHMAFKDFKEAYWKARAECQTDGSPFIIHFRLRTHGLLDAERTHPFMAGSRKDVAVVHNGVLSCVSDDAVKSDTQIFCETYPGLFDDMDRLVTARQKLGQYIGGSNKLACLFPSKGVVIINESYGSWVNGVWYSNRFWNSASYSHYLDN